MPLHITGDVNETYDLEEISQNTRLDDSELVVHVFTYIDGQAPNPKDPKIGQIWLSKRIDEVIKVFNITIRMGSLNGPVVNVGGDTYKHIYDKTKYNSQEMFFIKPSMGYNVDETELEFRWSIRNVGEEFQDLNNPSQVLVFPGALDLSGLPNGTTLEIKGEVLDGKVRPDFPNDSISRIIEVSVIGDVPELEEDDL